MPLDPADAVAIQQLYSRYNVAVDRGDGAAFAGCFTPDAVFDMGATKAEGSAALAEFASAVPTMIPGSRHIATNLLVEGDGDEASGSAYLMLLDTRTAPVTVIMSGVYEDRLVRSGKAWHFAERRFTADAPAS